MKKIIIIALSILLITGCGNKVESNQNKINNPTTTVNIQKIIDDNNYIIVDVRTKEEYDEGHLKNAINIPYDTIDEKVNLDKNKDIFVYCKSGKRSNIAYNTLTSLGYKVTDLGAYENITFFEKTK